MVSAEYKIGMFDSGIGGLSVLKACQDKLPNEEIIYFGDTARLPYGEKSAETVLRYSIENAVFLMEHHIKVLVIACNTASSVAVNKLRKIFNIPVIGVIEPGAEKAVQSSKTGKIAVLGTRGTIQSGAYQREILALNPNSQIVPIACPLFVPLIEEGLQHHPAAELIVKEYLSLLKEENVDTLLLGCTHYLSLKETIQNFLGNKIQIVDSASTCAEKVATVLTALGLRNQKNQKGEHSYFVSDNPEKFKKLGEKYIQTHLPEVKLQLSNYLNF